MRWDGIFFWTFRLMTISVRKFLFSQHSIGKRNFLTQSPGFAHFGLVLKDEVVNWWVYFVVYFWIKMGKSIRSDLGLPTSSLWKFPFFAAQLTNNFFHPRCRSELKERSTRRRVWKIPFFFSIWAINTPSKWKTSTSFFYRTLLQCFHQIKNTSNSTSLQFFESIVCHTAPFRSVFGV